MKSLFPQSGRLISFIILALSIALPFILFFTGYLSDDNLALIKASIKISAMFGALLLFFSRRRKEPDQVEKYRVKSVKLSIFFTFLFLFLLHVYHFCIGETTYTDSSSFLIFLIVANICMEFFMAIENYKNA